jgi:hypothetical protein
LPLRGKNNFAAAPQIKSLNALRLAAAIFPGSIAERSFVAFQPPRVQTLLPSLRRFANKNAALLRSAA